MILQKWTAGEIFFYANDTYENAFMEVDLNVTFTNENGENLIRPAFWLGGNKWCVRFAPITLGKWTYSTICSNKADDGLHNIKGELTCVPYEGDLEIYKRGFIKISENNRYFTYADGTPFYYLGDTHWLMQREPFNSSNVEGVDSTFKFIVDYRLTQGFTVYQSEPIGLSFKEGVNEKELKMLEDIDDKFKYIAEKGLLHTNAQLFFAREIDNDAYTPELLIKLTKMWAARYGAYPVMWTIAQEVDPDHYNFFDVSKWSIVGETLYLSDCYKHPLTGHMCNQTRCKPDTTKWGDKYYHSWFGMQPQGFALNHYREFYNYKITKPIVNYETGYEHLWSDKKSAYCYGYFSYLNGACGYGYGAHGIWNGNISTKEWMNYGGYIRWFEGVRQEGAKKFMIMNNFFKAFDWWNIVPHYQEAEWWCPPNPYSIYATLHDHTHFVLNYHTKKGDAKLLKVENGTYTLLHFNIEFGAFDDLGQVEVTDNTALIPEYPAEQADSTLHILTKKREIFDALPLDIKTKNRESIFTFKGDTLTLVSKKPCTYTVDDETIAKLEGNTLIAQGKNGIVTVTATSEDEVFTRKFLAVRQDKTEFIGAPEAITPMCNKGDVITEKDKNIIVVPQFTPDNYWEQTAELEILDENGNKADAVIVGNNYEINPIFDADVYLRFKDYKGNIYEQKKLTVTGYGEKSLTIGGFATSSDWHEKYDKRGLPEKAINGLTARFAGWASSETCSFEKPVSLIVTLKQPSFMNNIRLFLVDQNFTLRDFDVVVESEGKMTTVAEVRSNNELIRDFDFDKLFAEKIHVVCYKGDGQGYARIDQVNAYLK